nr:glycosyltransferase family 2 protein [uncultured Devosia sp.]
MLDLTIVVVNYKTGPLALDCLASVMADPSFPQQGRMMIVDAVSGDGSTQLLADAIEANHWGDRAAVLDLPRNGGFAYGNNRAIEAADARWGRAHSYLLLNPDTYVRPGAVGALVQFLADHPEVGMVGSSLEDPDGTRQACSFRFPSAMSELDGEARVGPISRLLRRWCVAPSFDQSPVQVDWVSGASMLVRGKVFDQIGMLDEEYFLYYEELDFCRRAVDAGWTCWTEPKSRVVHLCGQSTGVSDRKKRAVRRPTYWFNSRRRYFAKHHGRWGSLLADAGWIAGQAVWHLRQLVERRDNIDPPFLVRDFLAHRLARGSK